MDCALNSMNSVLSFRTVYVFASCRGDLKRVAVTQGQSRDKDNSNEVCKGRRGPSEGYCSLCSPSLQPDGGTVSPNALI